MTLQAAADKLNELLKTTPPDTELKVLHSDLGVGGNVESQSLEIKSVKGAVLLITDHAI